MGGFPINCGFQDPIRAMGSKYTLVHLRKLTLFLLFFYCELYCLFYGIDVAVKLIYFLSFEGTKGIIYITLPELRCMEISDKGSRFYVLLY